MPDDPSRPTPRPVTAFAGQRLLRRGPLPEVALAVKAAADAAGAADGPADDPAGGPSAVLVFDDATGRVVDLDLRGTDADVLARLERPGGAPPSRGGGKQEAAPDRPRGPGRPRLGVVPREVTLLPRHWDWLAAQPGGASATLRRLVEDARRREAPAQARRAARDAAYRFLTTMAGDLPGYEEATRALFAGDRAGLERHAASWPKDIRQHGLRLASRWWEDATTPENREDPG